MDAATFFKELYGQCDRGWLTIWTAQDKRTYWFEVSRTDQAAKLAQKLSELKRFDVYFGVGLRKEKIYKTNKQGKKYLARGDSDDVICIPGFWMDVDVSGDAHKEASLPPTIDEAIQLVEQFPLKPSILVHSGHGLHSYWGFKEPLYFESREERGKVSGMLERFQATIKEMARRKGWKLDTTSDLARVLRVPGTTNYKGDPVQVKIIKVNDYVATL